MCMWYLCVRSLVCVHVRAVLFWYVTWRHIDPGCLEMETIGDLSLIAVTGDVTMVTAE